VAFFDIKIEKGSNKKKRALSQNSFDKIKVSITEGGGIGGTFVVALFNFSNNH